MQLHEIQPYLTNFKKRGGQYVAACPVCLDEDHLFVKEAKDKVLLFCQKCHAEFKDIIKALNIPKDIAAHTPDEVMENYDHVYKNPDGSTAYYKNRTKYRSGKKKFSFYHIDNGKKIYAKPDGCNNLYNLDKLEAADPNEILYIVEGEKCADAMDKYGFLATTSNAGAGSKLPFSETDRRLLDKFIFKVVIPDNDEAGKTYSKNFPDANILNLVDIWPSIKNKQDVADFLKTNSADLIRNYSFKDIEDMDAKELICEQVFSKILAIKDDFQRQQLITQCEQRARMLNAFKAFNQNFKAYRISLAKRQKLNDGRKTSFLGQELILASGEWTADDYGVRKTDITNNGERIDKEASPIPLLPTEILFNLDSQSEKIKVEFYKDSKWQSFICDRTTTASSSKIIELANRGIEVNSENSKYLVKYIADCVSLNLDTIPRYKSISRMGWIDNKFMPYIDDVKFDGEKEYRSLYQNIHSKGDLQAWCDFIRPLRKNISLRMTMAASFASPIIEKVNGLPFVFHLWGGTGSGKTVALIVAMSVWGDSRLGKLVKTMNMTPNNMMSTAAFLCNLPMAGDELQTIKQRGYNYDSLIMRVCEGVDRGRMTYDRINDTKTWKCSFLFTGEEPCTKTDSGGGVKNRVIEHECNGVVVNNGNEVVAFLAENYGLAGEKFIDELKKYKLIEEYNELFKQLIEAVDTTEKQAMALAIMLLADKIASKLFFSGEPELTIQDVKDFACLAVNIAADERAYQFAINMIARNANKFDINNRNGELWGRIETGHIYINKDVLVKEMSDAGFEFDAVKRSWSEKGYLIKNTQGKFIHQTKVNNVKANYVKIQDLDAENSSEYENPY